MRFKFGFYFISLKTSNLRRITNVSNKSFEPSLSFYSTAAKESFSLNLKFYLLFFYEAHLSSALDCNWNTTQKVLNECRTLRIFEGGFWGLMLEDRIFVFYCWLYEVTLQRSSLAYFWFGLMRNSSSLVYFVDFRVSRFAGGAQKLCFSKNHFIFKAEGRDTIFWGSFLQQWWVKSLFFNKRQSIEVPSFWNFCLSKWGETYTSQTLNSL